jgi:hypothetical protein
MGTVRYRCRILTVPARWLFAGCVLATLHGPDQAFAQFTDAHTYDNTPAGTNQLETDYAFVHGNASIDSALVVSGASVDVNEGTIGYTRYFGLWHRLTWAEAALPLARLSGSVNGTGIRGSTAGAGDSGYELGMLVKGGPALNAAEFERYKPATIVGLSCSVTAPTGLYAADRILNLGSDRWSFKPEIALSHPFGPGQKWQVDAYANAYFYTDNSAYHGREILRQTPLTGVEAHVSYSFNDSVWISSDTRYAFRGATVVDGVNQDNAQQNLIVGSEMKVSITGQHSLLVEVAKAVVHHNSPAVAGVAVKYDYTWGQ